ncbi:MAG: hypothetical protein ABI963_14615 [Rhizomicrobium sp.]
MNTASSMFETYGDSAKFHVAAEMDRALEMGDGSAYDQLCLVAKAISLMSMTRQEAATIKPAKVATPVISRTFKAA